MTVIEDKRKELDDNLLIDIQNEKNILEVVESYDLDFASKVFLSIDILKLCNNRVEMAQKDFLDKLDKFSIPVMDEDGMRDFVEKNSDSSVFRFVKYSELKQSLSNHSPQTSQRKEGQ